MSIGPKTHQVIGVCPNCHTAVLECEAHAYFLGGGDSKRQIKPRTLVRHETPECNVGTRYVAFSGGESQE